MTNKIIRCAIYTRKSSEEGLEQDFNSLHAQREACEAFIKSQKHEGWQLIKTHYDDGGFSGGTMSRPALQALMQDIGLGKVDVVVVYKVDRLSRSLHDFAKMVEIFDRHKVSFVSVTQQFNTTSSMGRLTLNVLLSFAQFEREVTGERIRDKIAASKKKGMWMGGVVPLGYDAKDRKLVINLAEAKTVQYIFKRYLEIGNVRLLCEELARQKIVSKSGSSFSRGGLYHLLTNPIFTGQIRFKGAYHDGLHERIIDPEAWAYAQAKLAENRQGVIENYRKSDIYPLQGKLFDAATGEELVVMHTSKKGRRYRYYISRSLKQEGRCRAQSDWRLPAPMIEKTASGIIHGILNDRGLLMDILISSGISSSEISKTLSAPLTADPFSVLQKASLRRDGIEVALIIYGTSVSRIVPMQMKRQGNEMRLIIEGAAPPDVNVTLVKSIARAHVWSQELMSGKASSLADLAKSHGVSDSYVKKIMPLAFLAPDIVTTVLSGNQPIHLNNQMLIRGIDLPIDWMMQKRTMERWHSY